MWDKVHKNLKPRFNNLFSLEANRLFAQRYQTRGVQNITLAKSLKTFRDAITVHPNKKPDDQMWRKVSSTTSKLLETIRPFMNGHLSIPESVRSSNALTVNQLTWSRSFYRYSFLPNNSKLRRKLQTGLYSFHLRVNITWPYENYHVVEPLVGMHFTSDYGQARFRLLHKFSPPVFLSTQYDDQCRLNIVTTVSGRSTQLDRLVNNLLQLSKSCSLHLAVSVFETQESNSITIRQKLTEQIGSDLTFGVIAAHGKFSRSAGINKAFEQVFDNDPTLVTDIDMIFDFEFIRRCQRYPLPRHRLYFPIVLSDFDPALESVTYGYYRSFGFGMVCLHPSDFQNIGGLSLSFHEWGQEDVDFVTRSTALGYEVFR